MLLFKLKTGEIGSLSFISRHHTHITHITITIVEAKCSLVMCFFCVAMLCDEGICLKFLHINKMFIVSVEGNKLLVATLFYYLAIVYNAYHIGIFDGR